MGVCHSPRYIIIVSLEYTTFWGSDYFFLCMFNMLYDNIRKSLLGSSIHANDLAFYVRT